jgi:hypothetical protein
MLRPCGGWVNGSVHAGQPPNYRSTLRVDGLMVNVAASSAPPFSFAQGFRGRDALEFWVPAQQHRTGFFLCEVSLPATEATRSLGPDGA